MHTTQIHHLLCDPVEDKAASKLGKNLQATWLKLFSAGVAALAIVASAGCQQFADKTGKAPMSQPVALAHAITDAHDGNWISQAHAVAAKSGSEVAGSDLSY